MSDLIRLDIDAMAHGGDGIARLDGKTVFVPGAIPGDLVDARIINRKKRFDRAEITRLVEPSPDRIEPPCPAFGACGGCRWQHARHEAQLAWKAETVAGQLRHLGGIDGVDVRQIVAPSAPFHYRNRIDLRVDDGRPALFRAGSHELVAVDVCLLAAPAIVDLFGRLGDLRGVDRLSLRTGVNTGETVMILDGELPAGAEGWGVPFGGDEVVFHEQIAGELFQITGSAFFQVNTPGAEALVELVGAAASIEPDDRVIDAYAGGGLFTRTVAHGAAEAIAIESDPLAVEDLEANTDVAIIEADVGTALRTATPDWDVVIVDPPRTGLGPDVVQAISSIRPRTVASVSCDPASLARDARGLVDAGYTLEWVQPVDMFPQTPHVETVARFSL